VLNDEHVFRPNLRAMDADQFGAALALRTSNGLNPVGFRWGAELSLTAETGTFDFARPGVTLRAATPLPFGLLVAAEVAGGTSTGAVPVQSTWFLGGPATLRGYDGGITNGDAFWRSRLELSTQLPAARVVLFSDAGWAGPRSNFEKGRPLIGAGAGASFLDGLVRFDIARALRSPTGWRLDLYVSGSL
jgi:hemolysin activation/secretion protein